MKRFCMLSIVLVLLLCSCLPNSLLGDSAQTTPPETTPVLTTPEETIPDVTTPTETTTDVTTPDVTQPLQPPHEHLFEGTTVTQSPTCIDAGEAQSVCSCGEIEVIQIPATGKHNYVDNTCTWCQKTELTLIPVNSAYDADGDGKKDVYYFSTELAQRCADGNWLWAGEYNTNLSVSVSQSKAAEISHWYVEANSTNKLVYHVTVSESGMYEMVLHLRLKDTAERGAKYTFNAGTAIEQVFQTSHAFTATTLGQAQNDTEGTYMYGIYVYLQGGENTFSIECASNSNKTQHYRDFYFVKVAEEHTHNYVSLGVTKQPTCTVVGEQTLACACGDNQAVFIPATGEHHYQNGICSTCGKKEIPLYASNSYFDADGDGQKDVYYFSPELSQEAEEGIRLWAGYYNSTLSTHVNTVVTSGISHWYVAADGSEYIVYNVTIPEDGIYEMILHMRLKDGSRRGAKYIINEGTAYEQIFQTSHEFDAETLEAARNDTVGTYMYGIRVHFVAGVNTIKITAASSVSKTQHFRDFYFVKISESHKHAYLFRTLISNPTCTLDGEATFTCACGDSRTVVLHATQKHTYVGENCIACGQKDLGIGIVEYDFLFEKAGFAGGTISLIPEVSGIYTLYWADANGKLANYTKLGSVTASAGKLTTYSIHQNTAIPAGATRLIAVSSSGAQRTYSFAIPESRQFRSQKLYTFGAIADTHQGTRYGEESLPYNRFIKAGKILSGMNAILVGICGDISYENIEREYYLHGEAVKEIHAYDPTMPIYTVTGNHEAKYTGFSREWYFKYAREIVEYQTAYKEIFTDDNDLDYVVELPDGSVIIFLHQVYYDYNTATSRLLDDYQLDWLGERLEEYKDRTVFLFFHSQMQGKVGDFNDGSDRLDMCTYTEDYKRLDTYFKQYTNVIFLNGHSHNSFDNVLNAQKADRVINEYNGEYATLVHLPSLGQSQTGHIVHVYEDCIIFEGYHFGNEETLAYATFIIEK